MPDSAFAIRDEAALRTLYEPVHALAAIKSLHRIDIHARDFIARAPFVCIGTQNADGRADVSPRGDPAGFVRVLDDRTLAIPDRPGNNRLDTLVNILTNPAIGLLFLIPGFDDSMRVNGQASLTTDPGILEPMAVNGRTPKIAIIVLVTEVFIHCAKALRRSHLWDHAHRQDRAAMPSLMAILRDQTGGPTVDAAGATAQDAALEEDYQRSMY
jgi:uncharacterized protein